jgi:hypothetical protein
MSDQQDDPTRAEPESEPEQTPADPTGELWSGEREQAPGAVNPGDAEPRRLLPGWNRPDPRRRPHDPAGSYPRFQPEELLPESSEPLVIHARPSVVFPKSPLAAGPAAAAPPDAGEPEGEPPQAARFQFVLGALIAVAVAGLLLLLVAALDTNKDSAGQTFEITGPRWSSWAPYQGSIPGPTQIADHVAGEYKLPNGNQLVAITGGPLEIAGLPLTVALRQSPQRGGKIQLYDGTGALYRLCGLGDRCAIASGKASIDRHLLLRREALELALYSFRYLKGVNQVAVFLPPKKGEDPTQALYFRQSDVAQELSQPLNATISPNTPGVTNVRRSAGVRLVDQLTVKSLFKFSLTMGNADVRAFLVLDDITS